MNNIINLRRFALNWLLWEHHPFNIRLQASETSQQLRLRKEYKKQAKTKVKKKSAKSVAVIKWTSQWNLVYFQLIFLQQGDSSFLAM